jgi:hypothetical protein
MAPHPSVSLFPLSIAALLLLPPGLARSQDDGGHPRHKPKPFALTIHIATSTPKDSDERVAAIVATANEHFAAAGISFFEHERTVLPASFAILETQGERHRLKKYFKRNTINVFLLDEIRDPTPSDSTKKAAAWQGFQPSGLLAGAHIENVSQSPKTYIIMSRHGSGLILTHELGHFFGAGHSPDPSNIMSYGANRQSFDEKQTATFASNAKRFRKQHVLISGD